MNSVKHEKKGMKFAKPEHAYIHFEHDKTGGNLVAIGDGCMLLYGAYKLIKNISKMSNISFDETLQKLKEANDFNEDMKDKEEKKDGENK